MRLTRAGFGLIVITATLSWSPRAAESATPAPPPAAVQARRTAATEAAATKTVRLLSVESKPVNMEGQAAAIREQREAIRQSLKANRAAFTEGQPQLRETLRTAAIAMRDQGRKIAEEQRAALVEAHGKPRE